MQWPDKAVGHFVKESVAVALCCLVLSLAACSGQETPPAGDSPLPIQRTTFTQHPIDQATPAPLAAAPQTSISALPTPSPPAPGATTASVEPRTTLLSPTMRPTLAPTPTTTPMPTPTPAVPPSVEVNPHNTRPEETVTIIGTMFPSKARLSRLVLGGISVMPNSGILTEEDGTFTVTAQVPGLAVGTHLAEAAVGKRYGSTEINVRPAEVRERATPRPPVTPSPGQTAMALQTPKPSESSNPETEKPALIEPWKEGGTGSYNKFIRIFYRDLEGFDRDLARTVLAYDWFTDDENNPWDWELLFALTLFGNTQPDHAHAAAALPWLADDLTQDEWEGFAALVDYHQVDNPITPTLIYFPWVRDGIASYERETIEALNWLAKTHPDLGAEMVEAPWVVDGITPSEGRGAQFIKDQLEHEFVAKDPNRAYSPDYQIQVDIALAMGIPLDGQELRMNLETFRVMDFLPDETIKKLSEQPWVQDGLNEEEKAHIISLGQIDTHRGVLTSVLEEARVLSTMVNLPISQELNLYAVARPVASVGPEILEWMEKGTASIEGLMQLPWPNSNVVVLVEPEMTKVNSDYPGGVYTHIGHYISLLRPPGARGSRDALYHELGHFYFHGRVPKWFSEGTASFLESYALHDIEGLTLRARHKLASDNVAAECAPYGVTSITEWDEQGKRRVQEVKDCHYPIGELFLLDMYLTVGHEATVTALQELYILSETKEKRVYDRDIYQAFLANTPQGMEDKFHEIYQRWHGGPVPAP